VSRWTIHGTMHFVRDFQYCTKSSGWYLNVNNFTHVFMSYSTIKSCSTASPMRNKFLPSIVSCQNLLSMESVDLKIWRQLFKQNQQDATLHNCIYYYKCSTSFRWFLCPPSGAQNTIHSIEYLPCCNYIVQYITNV